MSDNPLKPYAEAGRNMVYSKAHLQETIQRSKDEFYKNESETTLSHAEFLYRQSRYINKRWWILQAGILIVLWFMFELTDSSFSLRRNLGIAAPLFAILLLPELWKNRAANALEIECTSYYSLRQVYAARILLFALVDLLLLGLFSSAAILTHKISIENMIIQFILPYTVTCCICFRTLYRHSFGSETFALLLCLVWCTVWTQFVLHEKIYEAVSLPVWFLLTMTAVLYLGYCIYRGQKYCQQIWDMRGQNV